MERVFPVLVDPFIGRKMASLFALAGLVDLAVHFEPDRLYTVVGRIDPERRRNWVEQLAAARLHSRASSEASARRTGSPTRSWAT